MSLKLSLSELREVQTMELEGKQVFREFYNLLITASQSFTKFTALINHFIQFLTSPFLRLPESPERRDHPVPAQAQCLRAGDPGGRAGLHHPGQLRRARARRKCMSHAVPTVCSL